MPIQVLHQLMQMALRYLQLTGVLDLMDATASGLELAKVRVVPKLHHNQPCCLVPFERHYSSVQEGQPREIFNWKSG
jgi:hypothetical protein